MLVKKELLEWPVSKRPKAEKNRSYAVTVTTSDLRRSGSVMNVDIFEVKTKKLKFRWFTDGKNAIWTDAWPAEKWHSGKIESRLCFCYAEQDKATQIAKFIGERADSQGEISRLLDTFACKRANKRNEETWQRKYGRWNELVNSVPDLPNDFTEYCATHFFDYEYLVSAGAGKARCSHCGNQIDKPKGTHHGNTVTCPACGRKLVYKTTRYGNSESVKVCIAQKRECERDELVLRWLKVKRSLCGGEVVYEPDNYFFTFYTYENGKAIIRSYEYKCVMGYGWDWFYQTIGNYREAFIYPNNLTEVFGEKYYNVNLQSTLTGCSKLNFERLLDRLQDAPQCEYLVKAGMTKLASQLDKEDFGSKCSFSGVLGIPSEYKPMFKEMDISADEYRVIKNSREFVSREEINGLRSLKITDYDTVNEVLNDVSLSRILRYVAKQKCRPGETLTLWRDYLSMSHELNVDISNKSVLMPKELRKQHDLLSDRVNEIRKQRLEENIAEAKARWLAGAYQFTDGVYCIFRAESREELIREGSSLNHCVGGKGYWERHQQGDRQIFFVRRLSDRTKPFFTMEVNMDSVRVTQLYGFGDCSAPPDVRKFANAFATRLRGQERKAAS